MSKFNQFIKRIANCCLPFMTAIGLSMMRTGWCCSCRCSRWFVRALNEKQKTCLNGELMLIKKVTLDVLMFKTSSRYKYWTRVLPSNGLSVLRLESLTVDSNFSWLWLEVIWIDEWFSLMINDVRFSEPFDSGTIELYFGDLTIKNKRKNR